MATARGPKVPVEDRSTAENAFRVVVKSYRDHHDLCVRILESCVAVRGWLTDVWPTLRSSEDIFEISSHVRSYIGSLERVRLEHLETLRVPGPNCFEVMRLANAERQSSFCIYDSDEDDYSASLTAHEFVLTIAHELLRISHDPIPDVGSLPIAWTRYCLNAASRVVLNWKPFNRLPAELEIEFTNCLRWLLDKREEAFIYEIVTPPTIDEILNWNCKTPAGEPQTAEPVQETAGGTTVDEAATLLSGSDARGTLNREGIAVKDLTNDEAIEFISETNGRPCSLYTVRTAWKQLGWPKRRGRAKGRRNVQSSGIGQLAEPVQTQLSLKNCGEDLFTYEDAELEINAEPRLTEYERDGLLSGLKEGTSPKQIVDAMRMTVSGRRHK